MAEPIEFRCPHCSQLYRLSHEQLARYSGRTSNCRKCQQPFTFPAAPPDDQPPAEIGAGVAHEAAAAGETTPQEHAVSDMPQMLPPESQSAPPRAGGGAEAAAGGG